MSNGRHSRPTCWCCPLPQPIEAREIWAGFCAVVVLRIERIRKTEGINSAMGDAWQAFDTPLPKSEDAPRAPGRIGRLMAVPTTPRDAQGRWVSGGLAS